MKFIFYVKIKNLQLFLFLLSFLSCKWNFVSRKRNFNPLPVKESIILGHTFLVIDQIFFEEINFHLFETNFKKNTQKIRFYQHLFSERYLKYIDEILWKIKLFYYLRKLSIMETIFDNESIYISTIKIKLC